MKFNDFVDGVKWHQQNNIPLHESVFRFGSDKFFETFAEARRQYNEGTLKDLHEWDEEILRDTDLGEWANIKNVGRVPLDMPISEEEHIRFEAEKDPKLSGFDPKTQYAIKRLQSRYPHAEDLLSALLADVEKNEMDDDAGHEENEQKIADMEQKIKNLIQKNNLKEACSLKCKYCGDMLGEPTTDCGYDSMDHKGDNWVMVDIDGDGDADLAIQQEDDTDYPQVANRNIDMKNVMDILKKYPEETKILQQDEDLMDIYGGDLYQALFDYYADEMPYGTMKARDGDPVVYIQDELDSLGILDMKILPEAEYQGKKVELNKPKRGGSKKFYVYVRNPKTKKVKKVAFGAAGGGGSLAVKLKDPKARKAFADRHNCKQKNDKTKPGYWACRLPRYAKSLGLSGGGTWW